MNFINTIRFKFNLWYLSILSLLLIFLGCGIYFALSETLHQSLDDSLKARGKQLAEFHGIISIIASGTFEEEAGELVSIYFYENGELHHISHKGHEFPVRKKMIDQALAGNNAFSTVHYQKNEGLRIYATHYTIADPAIKLGRRPAIKNDGQLKKRGQNSSKGTQDTWKVGVDSAALVIARPIKSIGTALDQLLYILLAAIPLTIAISGIGGVFLSRKAFNPVEEITRTALDIGEHDLSRRIPVETNDELGHLSEVLNGMIGRIERAFQRQKEFTADASHELRAPLAVIRAEATLTLEKERDSAEYRKSLEMIALESDKMSVVINQLLTLARADAGKDSLKFESIHMAEFITSVCDDIEVLCREKGLILELCSLDNVLVHGDRESLRRLLVNLLGNAIKYTNSGGVIYVGLEQIEDSAVISVRDTGIGIPPEDLPYVFERFYRVDKARSRHVGGSGLGLSICKQIAAAHNGEIEVESCLGIGSNFYVRIPVGE
ncbi:cell wall metabolism sensor histidine kinase WalK [Desulfovibrio sp. JC010]|uniref:sensor histidine kinase n=1 Tax=Desulfovibrio sp. JC010 TaxID=2593641 RepID=UPI0013D3295D|nr:HAMP domain-containing sensor histidine kinase [Desulfovibrio sp. JC010]NDV28143.1 HAMP domain-containing histidine kinase [Desulfovibrio sp. JC010]